MTDSDADRERLAQLLDETDETQKEIAEAVGIHQSHLSGFKNGHTAMADATYRSIVDHLESSGGSHEPEPEPEPEPVERDRPEPDTDPDPDPDPDPEPELEDRLPEDPPPRPDRRWTADDTEPDEEESDRLPQLGNGMDFFTSIRPIRRRVALLAMARIDGEVDLGDLSVLVATVENDISPSAVGAVERKRPYISLYQMHLDKLDGLGYLEWESRRKVLRPTERTHQIADRLRPLVRAEEPEVLDRLDASLDAMPWLTGEDDPRPTLTGWIRDVACGWLGVES